MFNKLKEKFKEAISKFSEESEEKILIVDKSEKEGLSERILKKVKKAITTSKINDEKFEEMFWDLEIGLLESNVAIEVIEKIKENLKIGLVNIPIERSKISKVVENELKKTVEELFVEETIDFVEEIKKKEGPYIILFVGVNGSGKTTTIAKIAKLLKSNNLKPILAASDTFRAAAIDQLEYHAKKLEIPIIKHDYGSDPSAVAFDAIKYAKAKNLDVVLVDTAGRIHSNANLIEELKKISRVIKPDSKIFVGESITGNDCVEQAKKFDEAIELDGVILTKSDVDEKGGTAISISYVIGKPVIYMGTGQNYGDIEKFNTKKIMESLGW
jgi:fused signal recognition particle receptor